jgi:glycosyltransferase involved in cell wall biosynthesis
MRIALVHHTRLPIRGYGGTERVVVALARGLAALGHEVWLIAPAGTRVPEARVIAVPPARFRNPAFDLGSHLPPGTDLVHAFYPLRTPPPLPWVWTLEGTTPPGVTRPANTIYVSRDHARRHGSRCFVYNGLDPADYRFRIDKDDYDLFLGRLHSSKGWQWAVAGAKAAQRKLVVAGGWRPSLSRTLRFAGEVDGSEKADLLAGARLLWMPALWDEPFGLTLIEALWSGTPVLGTRRGALPEVLGPEVAEFGDTVEELVAALPAMAHKDPLACRARAERHFSHLAMAESYLRCYRTFLATGTLPEGEGISQGRKSGE